MDTSGAELPDATGTGRKPASKRQKYTSRACQQCKRRKVKCSGEDVCNQCRNRIGVVCRYSPPPGPAPRPVPVLGLGNASDLSPAARANPGEAAVFNFQPPMRSAHRLTECTDPRFDGLSERVRDLEHTLGVLLRSAKGTEFASRSQHLDASLHPNSLMDEDDDVANQFVLGVGTSTNDNVTLSSQVAAISALLSTPPSPKLAAHRPNSRAGLLVEFPEPIHMDHLMDIYFQDFDGYFPFLDRPRVEARINSALQSLGYASRNCTVFVPIDQLSTIALACIMLALAESLDLNEEGSDGEPKPGWKRYLQCRRIVQRCSEIRPLPFDIISAQTLLAAYLMQGESLGAASQAATVAWQLAASAGLNNQKSWPAGDAHETLQRRNLWWTIYFLDRQISRRSGIPYHIRDTEFDVADFTHTDANDPTAQNNTAPGDGDYMQALINLARLWGTVWDTFFAIGRPNKGDWMEIEIMDARILNTRRQLPATLTWDSDELANYILSGESEPQVRRRIQLYTRLDLLRMLIRQNPVRSLTFAPDTAHMCSRLSRGIIRAYELFMSQQQGTNGTRATGYFATSSIVECIYHLAPVLQYSKDVEEHAACVLAFRQAHGMLVKLSPNNQVAEKALNALNGLIKKWSSGGAPAGGEDAGRQISAATGNIPYTPGQIYMSGAFDVQNGAGIGLDFGEWMDMSLGPLLFTNDFTNEVDFRMDA